MKKNLAKKVTLSILAGAVLFTTGSVWAADVTGQTTIIDSGIHDQIINGAKISGGTDSATYNTVKVSGDSTVVNSTINGAFILGGGTGNVNSNAVEISGGTLKSVVYGGQTYGSGDANYNTVTISGGTFDGSSQQIYGGYTASGDAKGNVINISGGTFGTSSSNTISILTAYTGDNSKATTNGMMNLSGNPDLEFANLIGGNVNNSNNVLNIYFPKSGWSSNSKINQIKNFNVINFTNLTWDKDIDGQDKSVITVDTLQLDTNANKINAWVTDNEEAMGANESMTLIKFNGLINSNKWANAERNVYIGVSSVATDKATIELDSVNNKIYIKTAADFPTQSGTTPASETLEITKVDGGYKYVAKNGSTEVLNGTATNVDDLLSKLSATKWSWVNGYSAHLGKTNSISTSNKTITLKDVILNIAEPYNTGSMLVGSRYKDSDDVLENNKVIINNSTFGGGNVYGALAQAEATGNSVEITGGTITDSGVVGNIYGAKVETGTASENTVSVSGTSELAGDIYGASAKGDASENKVTITGGEVYGDYIYGGYSETGNASGNVITIDGGTIGNASNTTQIYAGATGATGGAIENNIVNLSGAPDLKNAELHAGSKVGTGNVLNVGYDSKAWTKGGEIKDIRKFNVINFNNLAWEKGATVVKTSQLELNDTKVNVWITSGTVADKEESMILIDAGTIIGELATTGNTVDIYSGISSIVTGITGAISKDAENQDIVITLTGVFKDNDKLEIWQGTEGKYNYKLSEGTTLIVEQKDLADLDAMVASLQAKDWAKSNSGDVIIGRVTGASDQEVVLKDAKLEFETGTSHTKALVGSVSDDATKALNNNVVTIDNATFAGSGVYGAMAKGNATGNKVGIINNSIVNSKVYGAYSEAGSKLEGNSVNVEASSTVNDNIYGAYSANAAEVTATKNEVTVNGATAEKNVYGVYIVNGNAGSESNGNGVTVTNGTVNGSVYGAMVEKGTASYNGAVIKGASKVDQQVYGAKVDNGTASNNSVSISDTVNVAGDVYGASADGDAKENTVAISGGTVGGNVYGGYSVNGKADGNTVDISGGSFGDASIIAGYSVNGAANNNTMNLSGNPVLNDASLLGRRENGAGTGNTLNIDAQGWASNKKINTIGYFNVINIKNLTWNPDVNDSVIVVDHLHHDNTKVNAWVDSVNVDEAMTLITAGAITGSLNKAESKVYVGAAGIASDVAIVQENNKVMIKEDNSGTGTTSGTVRNDQILVLGESRAAATAFVNQGAELLETGMNALARNDEAGVKTFAAVYGNNSEYATGSHVNVNGWSGIVGVGKTNANGLTVGAFFENGDGNYSTHNVVTGEYIRGDGEAVYNGGGFLLRKDNADGVYTEASLRAGNLKNELRGAVRGAQGLDGYDINTTYYGAHVGIGKVMPRGNDGDSLDVYGKFLYTYHDGETFDIQGEQVEFDSVNSERLRLGFRLNEVNGKKATMYYGAAWEYEFNGDASDKMLTYDLETPSLGGSTVIGEIGFNYAANEKWSFDAQVRGYAGQREGFSGSVQANYAF